MEREGAPLPVDVAALQARLAVAEAERDAAVADAAAARAKASDDQAMIAHLKLEIAKLKRQTHGQTSERSRRLIDQLELHLEDLEASASEDELKAEMAAARSTHVSGFIRKRPARKPFPEHLPRERILHPAPAACPCCGGVRLSKLGEDITETLEVIPRAWKVIQHVREKVSCRDCETIRQAPAPFHVVPRGWAGPNLLAMVLFEKFGQHQPLNRQAERYAREGVDLSLSTLADQVGHCAVALAPLIERLTAHVMAAGRLHGDDTTVPVLAKGKTATARCWVYVRDDRPFGGEAPPAALFHYSRTRSGEHPREHLQEWSGVLQADAFSGYNPLYAAGRQPAPIIEAACWAHGRRKFFELADIKATARKGRSVAEEISPIALEAVKRFDAIFDAEREITGLTAEARHDARQRLVRPMVQDLHNWLRTERARMSKHNPVAKAINYMFEEDGRWDAFTCFLDDGRICLTNNAAERALRGVALGRKAWLFAGSPRGGDRAAFMYSLIVTAKMNDVDPQAWLADVLARLPDIPLSRLPELLPWNWSQIPQRTAA